MRQSAISAGAARAAKPLYRQLQPRPNGPPREQVVANQLARIHGAVLEACGAETLQETSVAALCRLAGISKRTFYEQFKNREDCLLTSCERAVGSVVAAVERSRPKVPGWAEELRAALYVLASEAAAHPSALRLIVHELDAGGPAGRERIQQLRSQLERIVVAGFERSELHVPFPRALGMGIVYGCERVLREMVTGRLEGDTAEVAGELASWILRQSVPLGQNSSCALADRDETKRATVVYPRPRLRSQRAHILRATAELAAEIGVHALSVERIADRAGISRDGLTSYYADAGTCFLASLDLLITELLTDVVEATRAAPDWPSSARRGCEAMLTALATNRTLRTSIFIEAPRYGVVAQLRVERIAYAASELLCANRGGWTPVRREAAVGALWGIVERQVQRGESARLPALAGPLTQLILASDVEAQHAAVVA
jgi:AcrR family transcriptional regulator